MTKRTYVKVTDAQRLDLISRISSGQKIVEACKEVGICYENAKAIHKVYLKEKRVVKRQCRRVISRPAHSHKRGSRKNEGVVPDAAYYKRLNEMRSVSEDSPDQYILSSSSRRSAPEKSSGEKCAQQLSENQLYDQGQSAKVTPDLAEFCTRIQGKSPWALMTFSAERILSLCERKIRAGNDLPAIHLALPLPKALGFYGF